LKCCVLVSQHRGKAIKGPPEHPAAGIRFHQQFMLRTGNIDEPTIRGLTAEAILRRTADYTIRG
jgi:hypothetical protein